MRQFGRNYTGKEKFQHELIFNKNYNQYIHDLKDGKDVVVNNFMDWNTTQKAGTQI